MTKRPLIGIALLFAACDSESTTETEPEAESCDSHADCSSSEPYCEPESNACIAAPPGSELGWGNGSAQSVTFTVILEDKVLKRPVDLGFDPSYPNRLWVLNRQDDSVVVITNPGTPAMMFDRIKDPAAAHFMASPPAFEFGAVDETYGQTFGICGDGNNGGDNFMGPALFSSELDVFATQNEVTGLGSHLDMLHSTTFCKGIAHVDANRYFAFNGKKGSIDLYDFADDHGPGFDDHSDGHIFRYVEGWVSGVDGVSSHLDYDPATKLLYIADTGNQRVLALDTTTGTQGGSFGGLEEVETDKVQSPSGVEVRGEVIFVSDSATSKFHAFNRSGEELRSLATNLDIGSIGGFTFGPDNKLYFVDILGGRVLRVDPVR